MDPKVQRAILPDGSLHDMRWYLSWKLCRPRATLDGDFTARQLRDIAEHMEANAAEEVD